jgi:hypothetical protein
VAPAGGTVVRREAASVLNGGVVILLVLAGIDIVLGRSAA